MKTKTAKEISLKRLVLLIGISAAAACTGQKDRTTNTGISCDSLQTIAVRCDGSPYPIDEIIDSTEYVRLETTDDNLIGYVSLIRMTDDCIVVTDKMNQGVFVFDRHGKALSSIKRAGRGPEEYTGISATCLSRDGKRIVIADCWNRKALFYDRNGRFLYSKPIPENISISEMEFSDDDRIVLSVYPTGEQNPADTAALAYDPRSALLIADTSFRIETGVLPIQYDPGKFRWSNIFNLQRTGTGIHFTPTYGDTVYRISTAGVEARFFVDMSSMDSWANPQQDITNEKFEKLSDSRVMFNGSFLETKSHALFHIHNKNETSIMLLYDKKEQKIYSVDPLKSQNPLSYQLIPALQRPGSSCGDRIIASIPSNLLCYGETPVNRADIPEKLMEGYTEDSNPVLMLFTLKSPEQK